MMCKTLSGERLWPWSAVFNHGTGVFSRCNKDTQEGSNLLNCFWSIWTSPFWGQISSGSHEMFCSRVEHFVWCHNSHIPTYYCTTYLPWNTAAILHYSPWMGFVEVGERQKNYKWRTVLSAHKESKLNMQLLFESTVLISLEYNGRGEKTKLSSVQLCPSPTVRRTKMTRLWKFYFPRIP